MRDYALEVHYDEGVDTIAKRADGLFTVATSKGAYEARVVVVAIGILGKPNVPDYKLPKNELRGRLHFDVTSEKLIGERALVVGGGDSAADFVHYLASKGFRVELAPRTYDHVVFALGGATPAGFLQSTGIALQGTEPVLGKGGSTNVPGLFVAGDLTAGGKGGSIITAFNSGVAAMRVICRDFLDCQIAPPEDRMRGAAAELAELADGIPRAAFALGRTSRG